MVAKFPPYTHSIDGSVLTSRDYQRIEAAIRFLQTHAREQPDLARLAAGVSLSPHHLQRLFRRWAGISPKRFLQLLTVEHAKSLLADSATVLDTALGVGLSGPSRLHDHFVSLEAVTPGQYRSRGRGLVLRYGLHDSPFGETFIATSSRGICALEFGDGEGVQRLAAAWPDAELIADQAATASLVKAIFTDDQSLPLTLWVRGSNFQIQVWRALLTIPPGCLSSYQQLARAIGRPTAVRAVGQAVASNPIAYLIPCHRVIRATGLLGGYRWGEPRKGALIAWENRRKTLSVPSR